MAYTGLSARTGEVLNWRDRTGRLVESVGQTQSEIRDPALSPDGRRAAVVSEESGSPDIWIHDLLRGTKTRFTFDEQAQEILPAWSPTGREIIYGLLDDGAKLIRGAADGTGEPFTLAEAEASVINPNWSRDGRYLVYHHGTTNNSSDISYIRLDQQSGASEPVSFVSTPANERVPKLSPDGRWLAYVSSESGREEVYIRPFPTGSGKWQVSVNGGAQPQWRGDGEELFYVEDSALFSVSASATADEIVLGRPTLLFESDDLRSPTPAPNYDVAADGQRFLTIGPAADEDATPPSIRFVQNWAEEFPDREQ